MAWCRRMRGGGGRGGAGQLWTVYEMAFFFWFSAWRWASCCDHAATSPAVLFRSNFSTSGASASVHRQSVLPCCEQRQVPTAVLGQGCLQARVVQRQVSLLGGSTSTRSSMCQLSCRGLFLCKSAMKAVGINFPHFYVARAVHLDLGTLFTYTAPVYMRQSTEAFGRMSFIFFVKSGLGGLGAVRTWKTWTLFLQAVIWRCLWRFGG